MLFRVYPGLAQVVYTTFYTAFPESKEQLDDSLKRYLAELMAFWILGNHTLMMHTCTASQTDSVFDT